jgi:hypothetical protein
MTKWLVEIKGDKFDLQYLFEQVNLPNLKLQYEDAKYYLRLIDLDSIKDDDEVRIEATKIIGTINGAAKIDLKSFKGIEIGSSIIKISENGSRNIIFYPQTIGFTIRIRPACLIKTDAAKSEIREPSLIESRITAAGIDQLVEKVLNIFGKEHNWANLRKICEIIESDVGSQIWRKGWTTKSKKDRFMRTSTFEIHHNSHNGQPPSKPMIISEAVFFIKALIDEWIRSKSTR